LLIGESRIGKSSILRQLGYLTEHTVETTVYFDAYVGGSPERFAQSLGTALDSSEIFRNRARRAGQKGLQPLLRLLEAVPERLTILVDEVDSIVVDRESARFIRSVASIGHKIVIATSRSDPSHDKSELNEPAWWNVFRIQYVGLFTHDEANDMLLTLSERSGRRFTDGECAFFIDVMGCYPFFLQWIGHVVFNRGFKDCATSQRKQLLNELAKDYSLHGLLGNHYNGWLERLDEKQYMLLLESASSRGIVPNPSLASLKSRGLLIEDDSGRWHPFSRLFGEYLRSLPKRPMLSAEVKAKIWQGLFPAIKTVFEAATKHYL